ncbi:MAG: tetratricopeptide repeat protein [Candidatus Hodarchaeales archaeon]|jgi:tetratricopeptide (TPR) repeat protein
MDIKQFFELFNKGKMDELINGDAINQLSGDEKIEGALLRAYCIMEQDLDSKPYKDVITQTIVDYPHNTPLQIITRLHNAARLGWLKGKYLEGAEELEKVDSLLETLPQETRKKLGGYETWLWHLRGVMYQEAEPEKALHMFNKGLSLVKLYPNMYFKTLKPGILNHIGLVHTSQGKYNLALKDFQQSIKACENIGNESFQTIPLGNISSIHYLLGDLEQSLQLAQKNLEIAQKHKFNRVIAEGSGLLGALYQNKGELETAVEHFACALEGVKRLGLIYSITLTLYRLVIVHLERKDQIQAKGYLEELRAIFEDSPTGDIRTFCLLAEALFLKEASHRFREKVQAQDILREIVDDRQTTYYFRLLAMLHLCDLLILELKMFEDESLMEEVENIIEEVYKTAQTLKISPIIIEILILQTKFALMKGQGDTREDLLDQALLLAQTSGLTNYETRVKNEQQNLQNEYSKWMDLINQNISLREKIDQAHVQDYLKEAIQINNLYPRKS